MRAQGGHPSTSHPVALALVGGSGSGKSWLAQKLEAALSPGATRLSEDDFYCDRSHLSPARREGLNFDHPRTIEWPVLDRALARLLSGRPARVPQYDFASHCRLPRTRLIKPAPVIIVDGLWLLRRPRLRRKFAIRVFLRCPMRERLRRRLARDTASRGRTSSSVRKQFLTTVEPMHRKYVAPQARWADLVLEQRYGELEINRMVEQVLALRAGAGIE